MMMNNKEFKELKEHVILWVNILHHPDVQGPSREFFNKLISINQTSSKEPISNSLPFFFSIPESS